jgi:hypothetical protein
MDMRLDSYLTGVIDFIQELTEAEMKSSAK